MTIRLLAILMLALGLSSAKADEINIAVAANFLAPMQEIAQAFALQSGHQLKISSGASAKFFAQITNGAPFAVLFSADDEIPARLEKSGHGIPGTRRNYAIGRLALWSPKVNVVDDKGLVLSKLAFRHLAIANPKTAPYGLAAIQTLTELGLIDKLSPRFVQGESIAQSYQFVASGNAELGFVAASQIYQDGKLRQGSAWLVPAKMHAAIRQDMLLLQSAGDSAAARALLAFMSTPQSIAIIQRYGYETPSLAP